MRLQRDAACRRAPEAGRWAEDYRMSFVADRLRRANDEAARLQEQIARESEQEARASERIARATDSLSRASSPSSAQHYQREVQSQQREVARHQSARARLSSDLARKQRDIANHQRDLMREQQEESRKTADVIRQLQEQNRAQQERIARTTLSSVAAAEIASHDAFISHASEDKPDLVRPLAEALTTRGLQIWYDEFQLTVGDSLRRSIDRGLAGSRFGIVVLSPDFFAKNWPQYELDGLVAKENEGRKVVLPLWHRVSKNDVLKYSPTLADRVALSTAMFTIEELADKLAEVLKKP